MMHRYKINDGLNVGEQLFKLEQNLGTNYFFLASNNVKFWIQFSLNFRPYELGNVTKLPDHIYKEVDYSVPKSWESRMF